MLILFGSSRGCRGCGGGLRRYPGGYSTFYLQDSADPDVGALMTLRLAEMCRCPSGLPSASPLVMLATSGLGWACGLCVFERGIVRLSGSSSWGCGDVSAGVVVGALGRRAALGRSCDILPTAPAADEAPPAAPLQRGAEFGSKTGLRCHVWVPEGGRPDESTLACSPSAPLIPHPPTPSGPPPLLSRVTQPLPFRSAVIRMNYTDRCYFLHPQTVCVCVQKARAPAIGGTAARSGTPLRAAPSVRDKLASRSCAKPSDTL